MGTLKSQMRTQTGGKKPLVARFAVKELVIVVLYNDTQGFIQGKNPSVLTLAGKALVKEALHKTHEDSYSLCQRL